jgi:hypothetical protein
LASFFQWLSLECSQWRHWNRNPHLATKADSSRRIPVQTPTVHRYVANVQFPKPHRYHCGTFFTSLTSYITPVPFRPSAPTCVYSLRSHTSSSSHALRQSSSMESTVCLGESSRVCWLSGKLRPHPQGPTTGKLRLVHDRQRSTLLEPVRSLTSGCLLQECVLTLHGEIGADA